MDPALPLLPNPDAPRQSRKVARRDQTGADIEISVMEERPLSIFLNSPESVTAMAIGDYPEYLALGVLHNQRMLRADKVITAVEHDGDINTRPSLCLAAGAIRDEDRRKNARADA